MPIHENLEDLNEDGQKVLVAQGGRGGLGNHKRRHIRDAMPGEKGVV